MTKPSNLLWKLQLLAGECNTQREFITFSGSVKTCKTLVKCQMAFLSHLDLDWPWLRFSFLLDSDLHGHLINKDSTMLNKYAEVLLGTARTAHI